MLVDGWEDIMRRSLYGNVLTKRAEFPVMLGLKDMTGARASADAIFNVTNEALAKMEQTWQSVIALVTDDPTVMQSVQKRGNDAHRWLIVSLQAFKYIMSRVVIKETLNRSYHVFSTALTQ
jgi:hypothetical protein